MPKNFLCVIVWAFLFFSLNSNAVNVVVATEEKAEESERTFTEAEVAEKIAEIAAKYDLVVAQEEKGEEGEVGERTFTAAEAAEKVAEILDRSVYEESSTTRRQLRTIDDYTHLGKGRCNNREYDNRKKNFGTNPGATECVDVCGDNSKYQGFAGNVEFAFGYVLTCRCYHTDLVTEAVRDFPYWQNWDCYAYNKGDQLAGTTYDDTVYFHGQGECQTTTSGATLVTEDAIRHVTTDYACARECFTYSRTGFTRRISTQECFCQDGQGNIKVSSDNDYSCYSKMFNRMGGTSVFDYEGHGLCRDGDGYQYRWFKVPDFHTTEQDAECAKACLDQGFQGLVGISTSRVDLSCRCQYDSSIPLPSPQNTYEQWSDGRGSGVVWIPDGNKDWSCYSLNPRARVFNCPLNSQLSTSLSADKLALTAECQCGSDGTGKTVGIYNDDTCDCFAGTNWCTTNGHVLLENIDCDSDGSIDSLCLFGSGYSMLKSQSGCNEVTMNNTGTGTKTDVITDCPAAQYGNQDLSAGTTVRTVSDYTHLGNGRCDSNFDETKTIYRLFQSFTWADCVGLCGHGNWLGITFSETEYLGPRYRLTCLCHYAEPITQVTNDLAGAQCYVYNKENAFGVAPYYFWAGAGPCVGSYNDLEFSNFEIAGEVDSDKACAEECATDEFRGGLVSFSRHVSTNKCYCQFQKDTTDFPVDNHGDGVGGVLPGADNRYSCYGHFQTGNQILDSKFGFIPSHGRTRFELKGKGLCRDSVYQQFPYFQIPGQTTTDTDEDCLSQCETAFDGISGIARHQISGVCFCHYDVETRTELHAFSNYTIDGYTTLRSGYGTGSVYAGFLKEFTCVGRVDGLSGFNFIGTGGCSDANGNLFPHFRLDLSHSDADCAKMCLEAAPEVLRGFTRNKRDRTCYCAYNTGATLPSPNDFNAKLWENEGGTGTIVQVQEAATDVDSCYAIDEASRLQDCPDNSRLNFALDVAGMKALESWCECNSGEGKNVYDVGDTCSCARPYGWCTAPGDEYFYLDCDKDGTLDSVCTNEDGYMVMRSQDSCAELKGTGDVSAVCNEVAGCLDAELPCNVGSGDEYSLLDCDGDGAKDAVCKTSGESYNVALSSKNCGIDNSVNINQVCPAVKACVRDESWCLAPDNRYFFIDCDGDGALDSMCQTGETTYTLQLSLENCEDSSATAGTLASVCPVAGCVRPNVWCGLPDSQYYYVDCNGDGVLDSHCRDEAGNTWTILSDGSGNCEDTRDRCPAADFCTHAEDDCNHAGSHFYWTGPRGLHGNESQCIMDAGIQWKDTNCYRDLSDVHDERAYILTKT